MQNNYLESNGLKESRELDYPEHQYAPHEYDALEYVAPAPVPAPNYPEVKYPEPLRPQALIQPRPLDHAAPAGSTAAIPVPEVKYHNNVESNLDRIRNLIKENRNLIAAQVINTLIKHNHQVIKCWFQVSETLSQRPDFDAASNPSGLAHQAHHAGADAFNVEPTGGLGQLIDNANEFRQSDFTGKWKQTKATIINISWASYFLSSSE